MTTSDNIIEKLDLDRFFRDSDHVYDVRIGTVVNQGGTRVVYLSNDVIRGIYTALEYEAGEAWRIILQNCGYLWGKRVASNLDREMNQLFKTQADELYVAEFVKFVEAYFRYHGWGVLSINLDYAPAEGVVFASLKNSIFEEVLKDVDGFVDQMIEGMLRSIFEHISGRELACRQIAAERDGYEGCQFVITAPERLEAVEDMIEQKAAPEDIVSKIFA